MLKTISNLVISYILFTSQNILWYLSYTMKMINDKNSPIFSFRILNESRRSLSSLLLLLGR
jgi:hypothetical protein